MATLKAIIFDIDGTLLDWQAREIDWEDYEREHIGRVFDYVNEHVHPLQHSRDRFFEETISTIIQSWGQARQTLEAPHLGKILLRCLAEQHIDTHNLTVEKCLTAYAFEPVPGVRVYDDVPPILETLKQQGLKLGLLTNAYQPMTLREKELIVTDILHFFDQNARISAADVGFIKPHPEIFHATLAGLGLKAEEAVFVGDSLRADIAGAKGVNMKAVLRLPPHYAKSDVTLPTPSDFEKEGHVAPDGVICTLDDLPPLLDQWYPNWKG